MSPVLRVTTIAALVIAVFTAIGIVRPSPPDDEMRFFEEDYDRIVYFRRGSFEPREQVPYLEVHSEYPELATWFMALPFLAIDDAPSDPHVYEHFRIDDPRHAELFDRYAILHSVGMAACLLLTIFFSAKVAIRLGRDPRWAWLMLLPASLFFTIARYDALPVMLIAASLWLLLERRYWPAVVVLSCAVLTKWYAILFLPFYWSYGKYSLGRRVLPAMAVSAATAAIVVGTTFVTGGARYVELTGTPNGASAIASLPAARLPPSLAGLVEGLPAGAKDFATGGLRAALSPYLHQGGRISNPGGLYQQLADRWFGLPHGGPLEGKILLALTVLQFVIAGLALFVPQRDPAQLVRWMCLATAFFVLFAKFYSPQWVMWSNALVLLFMRHRLLIGVAIALDLFLYFQFSIVRGTSLRGSKNPDGTWTLSDFWYHLYDVRIALTALFTLLVAMSLWAHRGRGEHGSAHPTSPA